MHLYSNVIIFLFIPSIRSFLLERLKFRLRVDGCAYFSKVLIDVLERNLKTKRKKKLFDRGYLFHPEKNHSKCFYEIFEKKGIIWPIFYLKTDTRRSFSFLNNQTLPDFLNLRLILFLRCSHILAKYQPECSYKRGCNKNKK